MIAEADVLEIFAKLTDLELRAGEIHQQVRARCDRIEGRMQGLDRVDVLGEHLDDLVRHLNVISTHLTDLDSHLGALDTALVASLPGFSTGQKVLMAGHDSST